jgi:hypothetical protein
MPWYDLQEVSNGNAGELLKAFVKEQVMSITYKRG